MKKASRLVYIYLEITKHFWEEAIKTSVYLHNRTETCVLPEGKTLVKVWYKVKPNIDRIYVFGCKRL